jgi:uncharacterized protein (TIGR02147 family)
MFLMINIFSYDNYRKLLSDLYTERKQQNKNFSYRYIGLHAGFNSAGYFTKILKGSANISSRLALNLAQVFGLDKKETEYFELLVNFNQNKTFKEKAYYLSKLSAIRKDNIKQLVPSQFEIFLQWYYVAIHQTLGFFKFRDDYHALARKIIPAISPTEAKKAVKKLEELGLIKKNSNGYYERIDDVLTTGSDYASVAVMDFQHATIKLACEVFDRFPKQERDVSSLTLNISNDTFTKISAKLAQTRREILTMAKDDTAAERVWQLNIQIFPLTTQEKGDTK